MTDVGVTETLDVVVGSEYLIDSFDLHEDTLKSEKKELLNDLYEAYLDIWNNHSSKVVKKGFLFVSHLKNRFFKSMAIFRLYLIMEDLVRDKLFYTEDDEYSLDDWYRINSVEAKYRLEEYRKICV